MDFVINENPKVESLVEQIKTTKVAILPQPKNDEHGINSNLRKKDNIRGNSASKLGLLRKIIIKPCHTTNMPCHTKLKVLFSERTTYSISFMVVEKYVRLVLN